MSHVINLWGPSYYECDFCGQYEERMVTDTYTQKDICFGCASAGGREGGLFYTVTMSPSEDGGDNLMERAKEYNLLREEDNDEDDDEEALAETSA